MRRSPLAVLFLTVFLDLVGFGIIIPLLPFYAERFGASPFLVGALMASYSLMQFLVAPLWGRLSDRVGRRPVILVSVAGSTVSMLAFGLAQSYPMLLLARAFAGAAGANLAAAQAYVADVTTREDRARGMGAIGAAFGLGFILGPALGGWFGQFGFAVPAFVAAGLALANLALAFLLLPESRPPEARGAASKRWRVLDVRALAELGARPGLRALVVVGFLGTLGFSMMEAMFGLWGSREHGFDQTQTGYVFAFIGVLVAVMQGALIGPLTRRLGERRLLALGLGGLALALALLPVATSLPALLGVVALLAVAHGAANPSLFALLSLEADAGEQGGALGLAQSLSALARVLGPLWSGLAFGALGVEWPFWSGALGIVVALVVALAAFPRLAAPARPAPEGVA